MSTDETPPLLRPVATRVVRPEWASRVVSPAYDSVRPEQRVRLMETDPYVFLHVTRSPGDHEGMSAGDVGRANAEALDRLLEADLFTEVRPPGLYLYQLRYQGHTQTAVVGDVALAAYADGRIRPHERVRPQRSAMLADHLERIGINSSPIALGYRDDPRIDAIVAAVTSMPPLVDFQREDNLGQTIWALPEEYVDEVVDRLAEVRTYIIDGHHRVTAAYELWERSGHAPDTSHVLGALFPVGQLRVCAFHRRVADLNGHTAASLVQALRDVGFVVDPLAPGTDPNPASPGHYSMYVDHVWYRLAPSTPPATGIDDATALQDLVLGPLLDVDEAGSDARLDYLPGNAGVERLMDITDRDGGVAFALHPVTLHALMEASDRGETLPPKSTYFEPKVRSGVFISPR